MPIACRASRMRLFASADSVPSLRHRRHAMPPQTQCHSTTWLHVVSRIASLRQCAQHCRRPLASPAAETPSNLYLAGPEPPPPFSRHPAAKRPSGTVGRRTPTQQHRHPWTAAAGSSTRVTQSVRNGQVASTTNTASHAVSRYHTSSTEQHRRLYS